MMDQLMTRLILQKKFDIEILNLKNRGFRATGEPVLARGNQ